jgi:hypothetical protein
MCYRTRYVRAPSLFSTIHTESEMSIKNADREKDLMQDNTI